MCDKYQQQKVGEDPLLCSLQELGEYMTVDTRIAARQGLDENEEKTYMSVNDGAAELEAEGLVVVMNDGDGVNSENEDNELVGDNANTKDDGVTESEYNHINLLRLSLDFSSEQPNFIVLVSKIIDFAPLAMVIAFNLNTF